MRPLSEEIVLQESKPVIPSKPKLIKLENDSRWQNEPPCSKYKQGSLCSLKRRNNLPKDSVVILKKWLLDHRYYAYPNDLEKNALSKETNLTQLQINNWFINARRRLLPQILKQDGEDPQLYRISRRKRKLVEEEEPDQKPASPQWSYDETGSSSDYSSLDEYAVEIPFCEIPKELENKEDPFKCLMVLADAAVAVSEQELCSDSSFFQK